MQLVLVELDASAELICDMDLGRGRDRRMERGCDGRRESGWQAGAVPASGTRRVRPESGGGVGGQSPSHDGGWCRRAAQAGSILAGVARASRVVPRAGAHATRPGSVNE
jgi:hypothetical protein